MFLKPEIFKAILFRPPVKLPLSYWVLVGVRFLLTIIPQRGYIHPDEFFQNVEVIAGMFTIYIMYVQIFNCQQTLMYKTTLFLFQAIFSQWMWRKRGNSTPHFLLETSSYPK